MQFLTSIFLSFDWPNLIVGAVLGAAIGLVVWILTRAYDSWIVYKDLPYPIGGRWLSAEFDPKGESPREERNTITRVKVRRGLGGSFSIRVLARLPEVRSRPETAWRFSGKLVHGDTLVGTWRSTVKNTKRFGTAIIKFIEYGRAVGYWSGPAGKDYPVYGYWIMSRNEEDLRILAKAVLDKTSFEFVDVVEFVLKMPPPEQIIQKSKAV